MFYFVLVVHSVLSLFLIGVVLLQQGKGADMGAALGGGSNTIFGASGANNLLVKVTTTVAVLFMFTSIILVNMYFNHAHESAGVVSDSLSGSVLNNTPAVSEAAPVAPVEAPKAEAPVAQAAPAAAAPAVGTEAEKAK